MKLCSALQSKLASAAPMVLPVLPLDSDSEDSDVNKHIGLVAWSHTKLVCSELVCTLMAAYVFHRVLHMLEVGNIDILSGSLTNNGMVPARNFEIM